jgi:hypothetical protein
VGNFPEFVKIVSLHGLDEFESVSQSVRAGEAVKNVELYLAEQHTVTYTSMQPQEVAYE